MLPSRAVLFSYLLRVACLTLITIPTLGQSNPDPVNAQGFVPWGSFQHTDIDSLNMLNGSMTLHIPLFSLPQRGGLSLSFSIQGNTTVWNTIHQCTSGTNVCYTVRGLNQYNPTGPRVVLDQVLDGAMNQYRYPANSNTFYNVWSLTDASGAPHPLGYDNSNTSLLRATDGSGFLYVPVNTPDSPYSTAGDGTIYTSSGIRQQITNSSSSLPTRTFKDADGNTIVLSYTGTTLATSQIADSIGRTFPGIPYWYSQHTSSTSGCPTISANYQPTTSCVTWTVPVSSAPT
jgi:hypothetical protein